MHERPDIDRPRIAAMSAAIALVCVVVLTLQIRDRWQSPEVKSTNQAEYMTTGQAAHTAGAKMQPTDPKLAVEPTPDGPQPAQPANPN